MRTFLGGLATTGEVILVALAVPMVILALGLPVVLVARILLEVVRAL